MSAPASATCPRCGAFAPMLPLPFGFLRIGTKPTHRCSACGEHVFPDLVEASSGSDRLVFCSSCSQPLDGDPDEVDDGITPPECGECNRSNSFTAIEEQVMWEESEE